MLFLFSFLILLVQNIYRPLLQIYEVVRIQNSMLLMHLIYIDDKERKAWTSNVSRTKFSKMIWIHDLHFHSFIVTYRCTSSRFLANVLDMCVRDRWSTRSNFSPEKQLKFDNPLKEEIYSLLTFAAIRSWSKVILIDLFIFAYDYNCLDVSTDEEEC